VTPVWTLGSFDPPSMAIQGTTLYWSDDRRGVVMSRPAGGTATTLASGVFAETLIGFAAGQIYLENPTGLGTISVLSLPLGGGTVTRLFAPSSTTLQGSLAISGTTLYGEEAKGDITALPLDGGPSKILAVDPGVDNLVADADNLYGVWGGSLKCVPLRGGPEVTLASAPEAPEMTLAVIAVDATSLYWVDLGPSSGSQNTGYVAKVSKL